MRSDISAAYFRAVSEFNESDFARAKGFVVHPTVLQMAEIEAVAARLPVGGTVIDIGTGTGIIPATFRLLGHRVVALDPPMAGGPSPELLRVQGLGAEIHAVEVGEAAVPLPDGCADVVIAADVVEHLPHSPRPFMTEIMRLLKPGGWCILTTPNAVRLSVRIKVLLGHSNWMPLSAIWDKARNTGHHKEYTAPELRDLMTRAGFAAVDCAMVEDILSRANIARSPTDIRTKSRFDQEATRRLSFDPRNPMEYVRVGMLAAVTAMPFLRSSLLCQGRKP